MALTREDIQAIREALKPDLDEVKNEVTASVDKKVDAIEKKIDTLQDRVDNIQTHVDKKFATLEETLLNGFRTIIEDIYELHPTREEFNTLQTRVRNLENKLNRQGSAN